MFKTKADMVLVEASKSHNEHMLTRIFQPLFYMTQICENWTLRQVMPTHNRKNGPAENIRQVNSTLAASGWWPLSFIRFIHPSTAFNHAPAIGLKAQNNLVGIFSKDLEEIYTS